MVKIYIGNLSWRTTDDGLKRAFERFGEVNDANVARDRETGRSLGFGFVKMEYGPARTAIEEMNGAKLDGRVLKVSEARPRGDRANCGGRGFHGGNGGRGYGKRWPRGDCGNREMKIDMEANASKHLEFQIREEPNGKFSVTEYFTDGGKLVYLGFPTWDDAERFVLAQPDSDCWGEGT